MLLRTRRIWLGILGLGIAVSVILFLGHGSDHITLGGKPNIPLLTKTQGTWSDKPQSNVTVDDAADDAAAALPEITLDAYREALEQHADEKKRIILAMIDSGVVHVTLNFYETSIRAHNITNMLFVSVIRSACVQLHQFNVPCFAFADNEGGKEDSKYMSPVFLAKMNIRTNYLRHALEWGFSVLQTDIDEIYFKNPFPYFDCAECKIEALQDSIKNYINAGFVFVKSNKETINIYKKMVKMAKDKPLSEDQGNLNALVRREKLKYRVLDTKKFQSGLLYYEQPKRYFADTAKKCDGCVVVHNNWIVSTQAKVYRAKEMLHWYYDGDGYYTNPKGRYIMYDNTNRSEFFTTQQDALIDALAIGQVLNRSVILPKFHCSKALCPLNFFIYINRFDKSFDGLYREHSFLLHPKVPKSIVEGKSKLLHLGPSGPPSDAAADTYFVPKSAEGATSEEILEWFQPMSDTPILHFHSLKNAFSKFTDDAVNKEFVERAKAGFKKGGYRQYKA